MEENENVKNQDDALNDTVRPDMESQQEPVEEQPKQEQPVEGKEDASDKVSDKKLKRFKIRHAQEKALEEEKVKYAELNDKYLLLASSVPCRIWRKTATRPITLFLIMFTFLYLQI